MTVALTIATCAGAEALAGALAQAFARMSGMSATLDPVRTRAGLHALSAGVAAAAIVDRPAREAERRPFRQIAGQEALSLRIARRDPARLGRAAPGAYVHPANPVGRLTRTALGRIVTTGGGGGDIALWRQAGVAGPFGERRIHLYGPRDDGGFMTNVRLDLFAARQFAASYETLADEAAVIAAVREDRFGVAILDERPEAETRDLRRVAIAADAGPAPVRDPLDTALLLLVGSDPGGRRFARFALSAEGQSVVARAGGSGVSALDAGVVAAGHALLDRNEGSRTGAD